MHNNVGVAILGVGVVGGGTYQTLVDHKDFYLKTQGVNITVEAVLDKSQERMDALGIPQECRAQSIEEIIANPNVDIVVETIGGVGVAKAFVTAALRAAKTVVTSNKELIIRKSFYITTSYKIISSIFYSSIFKTSFVIINCNT